MASEPATAPLEAERDRLKNALAHLERSQEELRAALEDAPEDADFKEAMVENAAVIHKYAQKVAMLEEEIALANGDGQAEAEPQAADSGKGQWI